MRRSLQAATVALTLLVGPRAHAFCRTTTCDAKALNSSLCETDLNGCAARGIPLYWPKRCIPLAAEDIGSETLGYSAEELHEITLSAANEWTNASCAGLPPSMQFVDSGPVECGDVEYNPNGPNANIVMARDSNWKHDLDALGVTTVTFRSKTGEILNADVELNSDLIVGMGLVPDLTLVITHELGHVLGLSHSPNAAAIMYSRYMADRAIVGLEEDDIQGVCAVYTPGRSVPECDALKDFDSRCGGNVVGSCALANATNATGARTPGAGLAAVLGFTLWSLRRARRGRSRRVQRTM